MRTPEEAESIRGFQSLMPQFAARMQTNLDTCSLVLDFRSYTRTCKDVQGGIWMVNGTIGNIQVFRNCVARTLLSACLHAFAATADKSVRATSALIPIM